MSSVERFCPAPTEQGEKLDISVKHDEMVCCGCGKKGCLEQYASATGVIRNAKQKLTASDMASELRSLADITAKDVFDCAKAGDELALSVVDDFGRVLGEALAHVACVCDPEVFIIGGGVSKAGRIIIDVVQNYYKLYAFHASRNAEFVLATLDNDAGIYGSFRLLL